MNARGSFFSTLATSVSGATAIFQRYGLSDVRSIAGITALRPASANSTAALPTAYDCSDIGLRRDVPRGALQVVGDRPVILVMETVADDARDQRTHASQLRVAERILRCPASAISLPSALRNPSDTPMQQ